MINRAVVLDVCEWNRAAGNKVWCLSMHGPVLRGNRAEAEHDSR